MEYWDGGREQLAAARDGGGKEGSLQKQTGTRKFIRTLVERMESYGIDLMREHMVLGASPRYPGSPAEHRS